MNTIQIRKQMMEFNKMTFDHTINAMLLMQDQTRRFVHGFVDRAAWIPDNEKRAIDDMMLTYKKGIESFKTAADEGYTMIHSLFDHGEKIINEAQAITGKKSDARQS